MLNADNCVIESQNKVMAFKSFEDKWLKLNNGVEIESEFERIRSIGWSESENNALFNMDLTEISKFQLYLLNRVTSVLEAEKSRLNQDYVRTHLILDQTMTGVDEGRSGDGILLFHEEGIHFIVGDLHSDDESLETVLEKSDFFNRLARRESFKVIFMGDYVDRGQKHLRTIEHVLMLKTLFPNRIYLLRGNHDGGILKSDGEIILPYGLPPADDPKSYFPLYLKALISENKSFESALLPAYLNCFDQLPYIGFIKKEIGFIQCVHGGLPRPNRGKFNHIKSLSDLTQLKQDADNILHNIMWSDPYRGIGELKAHMKRFYFTEMDFKNYRAQFGIALLFRGHEVAKEGIQSYFEETLFTVFSSGETCSTYYKDVSPKIVKLDVRGNYYFL